MKEALDNILRAGVERGDVPGVNVLVVDREGVRYEGGFGERALASGEPMSTDTVSKIFSMTKAVTAAAAMQLVERGALSLDDPAGNVCKAIADVEVLTGFDQNGRPVTRPPARPVTLRHLLTHTSGYSYDIWDADCGQWYEATGTPTMATQKKTALMQPLMFDPGTRWRYGIGIDWAGQMVEAVSGLRLGDYFREHLTGPLGMESTAFDYAPEMAERAATLHARTPAGTLTPLPLSTTDAREFDGGGDGLKGTIGDYGRFIRMLLNDGKLDGARVLAADTVAQMCRNQIGDLRVEAMRSRVPAVSNDGEFFPGEEKSWGLSFQINEVPGFTGRPAGTLMWAGLANSYYWIDRENGIGGAFISQILPFADTRAMALYFEMESKVYQML